MEFLYRHLVRVMLSKVFIIWGTTAYFQFSTISFQTIYEVRFSISVKSAQENKALLSFICVYPSGSAERRFHSGTLWPVRPQRSIPGSAAGQRVRGAAEHAQLLSCAPAGTGGGSEPAGGAQTGDGSLQKDAGEDDGAASRCWEQTQEGKSPHRHNSEGKSHLEPLATPWGNVVLYQGPAQSLTLYWSLEVWVNGLDNTDEIWFPLMWHKTIIKEAKSSQWHLLLHFVVTASEMCQKWH